MCLYSQLLETLRQEDHLRSCLGKLLCQNNQAPQYLESLNEENHEPLMKEVK